MVATRRQRAAIDHEEPSPLLSLPDRPVRTPPRKSKPPNNNDNNNNDINNNDNNTTDNNTTDNNTNNTADNDHNEANGKVDKAHHGHRGCPAHLLQDGVDSDQPESSSSRLRSYLILSLFAFITFAAHPGPTIVDSDHNITPQAVFYYGWISAISTGLGVLPLCFVSHMNQYYIGISNAIAAGMMMAASYSLVREGCCFQDAQDTSWLSSTLRTITGTLMGLLFILATKSFLEKHDDIQLGSLTGADTRKILLIIFVMTLHSFSEGVGIGVSFGGEHGRDLGVFISASLAVHNVPEGLAVAIVLLPKKVSKASAAIWCVVTSLPQPIMAVPAFLFVHSFLVVLPVGLGFAGGAMMWVAVMELLVEAYQDMKKDWVMTGMVSGGALAVMIGIQRSIDEHS